jgi:hypothetical protein
LLSVPEVRSTDEVVDTMNDAQNLTLVCLSAKQTNLMLYRCSENKLRPRSVDLVPHINTVDIVEVLMKADLAEVKLPLFIPLHSS